MGVQGASVSADTVDGRDDGLSHAAQPLRALRVSRLSSRSLVDDDLRRLHNRSRLHLEMLPAVDDHGDQSVVQLQRASHAPGLFARSKESLVMGASRLRRFVVATGKSAVPQSSAVVDLSKRVSTSVSSTTTFYRANYVVLYKEVLCGLAATLLMIPETVAFSYVANLDPLTGLYATGFFGILIGFLGGVPSTVAGAAGALAVVMPQLTSATGTLSALSYEARVHHLFVAIFLAGLFQLVFGILELSRFFSMIPRTAHIGFLNGLALMMFLSQKTTLQVCTLPNLHFGACEQQGHLTWMKLSDASTWTTLFTVVITILIMVFWSRVPRVGRVIPPTLIVALVGVGFEFGINRPLLGYNVRTIGDTSPLHGSFPTFHVPRFGEIENWSAVLSCAASLAMVGIFESIMTLQAVVDLHKTQLSRSACRRECVANGLANVVCGLFSAMGGCSMIGQSTGNVLNGARHRLSAVTMGVAIFMIILFGSSVIELVPVACLTGILLVIIAHTFYWPSLQLVFRLKVADAFAIVLVTTLAAVINLAVAVLAGVVWQSLVNGWTSGHQIFVRMATERIEVSRTRTEEQHEDDGELGVKTTRSVDAKVYYVSGTLLYSSVMAFRSFFHFECDPDVVVVDFRDCHFADFSAVAALKEAATRYHEHGKTLVARHLDVHATDLVLHRDIGWERVDHAVLLTKETVVVDETAVHFPSSPVGDSTLSPRILSPRSPAATAVYHVLHE